jgi:hypothetical protein
MAKKSVTAQMEAAISSRYRMLVWTQAVTFRTLLDPCPESLAITEVAVMVMDEFGG